MDINENIFRLLDTLKNRPSMIFTGQFDYTEFKIYIEGYIDGLSLFLGRNFRMDITKWFNDKVNCSYSIYWVDAIPLFYADKNSEEHKELLISITKEYFEKHPNWYKI